MECRNLLNRIQKYCADEQLLAVGDRVVVGVSGGADSMCLLHMLLTMGYHVTAVHVNHGIREEAGEDEAYVRTFCEAHGIDCVCVHADVPAEAKRRKLSEEETGRVIRYEALEEVCKRTGAQKIALAHHRDDQAETILLNLFRGSGPAGLAGMAPRREMYIRPLLEVGRTEIEAYLTEYGIQWQTDRTNLENTYTRNKIRNLLMPVIEKEINAGAAEHIASAAGDMQQLRAYLDRQTQAAVKRCIKETQEGLLLMRELWLQEDPMIRRELVKKVLERAAGAARDLGRRHFEALEELMDLQVGRSLCLPYDCTARRVYKGVLLTKSGAVSEEESASAIGALRMELIEIPEGESALPYTGEKPYTKCFDYDIIKYRPELRTRRTGDYLTIDERGGRQSLKKYFINEKIPSDKRDSIPLAAIGDEILWVIGHRMGEWGKITEQTRRVLQITYLEGQRKEVSHGIRY